MDYKALMDAKKAENEIKESKSSLTEKIEAIQKEIGLIDDDLERAKNECKESIEHLLPEWKVLYHIREILEK